MAFYLNGSYVSDSYLRYNLLHNNKSPSMDEEINGNSFGGDVNTIDEDDRNLLTKLELSITEATTDDLLNRLTDILTKNNIDNYSSLLSLTKNHLIAILYLLYEGRITEKDIVRIFESTNYQSRTELLLTFLSDPANQGEFVDFYKPLEKITSKMTNYLNPNELEVNKRHETFDNIKNTKINEVILRIPYGSYYYTKNRNSNALLSKLNWENTGSFKLLSTKYSDFFFKDPTFKKDLIILQNTINQLFPEDSIFHSITKDLADEYSKRSFIDFDIFDSQVSEMKWYHFVFWLGAVAYNIEENIYEKRYNEFKSKNKNFTDWKKYHYKTVKKLWKKKKPDFYRDSDIYQQDIDIGFGIGDFYINELKDKYNSPEKNFKISDVFNLLTICSSSHFADSAFSKRLTDSKPIFLKIEDSISDSISYIFNENKEFNNLYSSFLYSFSSSLLSHDIFSGLDKFNFNNEININNEIIKYFMRLEEDYSYNRNNSADLLIKDILDLDFLMDDNKTILNFGSTNLQDFIKNILHKITNMKITTVELLQKREEIVRTIKTNFINLTFDKSGLNNGTFYNKTLFYIAKEIVGNYLIYIFPELSFGPDSGRECITSSFENILDIFNISSNNEYYFNFYQLIFKLRHFILSLNESKNLILSNSTFRSLLEDPFSGINSFFEEIAVYLDDYLLKYNSYFRDVNCGRMPNLSSWEKRFQINGSKFRRFKSAVIDKGWNGGIIR